RTIVFCNTVKSCRAAEFALREVDVAALSYHGEVPSGERVSNLERFKAGEADYLVSEFFCACLGCNAENKAQGLIHAVRINYTKTNKFPHESLFRPHLGWFRFSSRFQVCTDIAARGLDMPDVEHVLMFDFPLNPIDYLHRSGKNLTC
ncbi:unnamed protein product, partial [Sphacelaria rigidula]